MKRDQTKLKALKYALYSEEEKSYVIPQALMMLFRFSTFLPYAGFDSTTFFGCQSGFQ
jgi:hypothetical protein